MSKRKDIREEDNRGESKVLGLIEEDNRIIDAFIDYCWNDRPDYEHCEIERADGMIFVLWYEPEHMRGCLSPRTFHVVKVDNSYAFEEV